MRDTRDLLLAVEYPRMKRQRIETLQANLGYLCNQRCSHCHVNAGPHRTELMQEDLIETMLAVLKKHDISTLDLTGGAPELNPHFRQLVTKARAMGVDVIDRCNLTVLFVSGQEGLAEFLADQEVHVVASMPCYMQDNVDRQRGKGVYGGSIQALKLLNRLGYAAEGSDLVLDLVFNPQGPELPPPQAELEVDYREYLLEHYDIRFNSLFTIANLPISRFGSVLLAQNQFSDYMTLLQSAHRTENMASVMCRNTISVDYQGYLYDCDFNQMLKLPLGGSEQERPHLSELLRTDYAGMPIRVAGHCFGCSAGQGSSCTGALN